MDFTQMSRADALFNVAVVPRLCTHYNSAVVDCTVDKQLYNDEDGTRRWEGHRHYDGSWCSVHTINGQVERASYATNLPTRFGGFNAHHVRKVCEVYTTIATYVIFADSAMLRISPDGLVMDTYVLHLTETSYPEVGRSWRPYVKGHGGNAKWAGWLNTKPVLGVEGSFHNLSLLRA